MKNTLKLTKVVIYTFLLLIYSCSNDDDNAVIVSLQDFEVTINENPNSGDVLGTVQSSTTASLMFSITSQTPSGALSINESTGELSVADANLFDYESITMITATVNASGASNTAYVVINLTDIADVLVNYTVTIQPDETAGKDAFIYEYNADQNLGTHPDFMAGVYNDDKTRNLIRFNFSEIPTDAIVDNVNVSLYSYNSSSNGTHLGNNSSLLQRVTSSWEEDVVTWNNQPSTTSEDEVTLENTTQSIQDYLDVDITGMASYMIANPSDNYGFLLRLADETGSGTRRMLFASSDNQDSDLHPKVVVQYSVYE